jgi:hypothetical protein
MSDFECRYGHLMSPRDLECACCAKEGRPGERIIYMDGMTARQLAMMEREEAKRELWTRYPQGVEEEEDND